MITRSEGGQKSELLKTLQKFNLYLNLFKLFKQFNLTLSYHIKYGLIEAIRAKNNKS